MLVIWTLRKADQKYLESFKMWRWRKMETAWPTVWQMKKYYIK